MEHRALMTANYRLRQSLTQGFVDFMRSTTGKEILENDMGTTYEQLAQELKAASGVITVMHIQKQLNLNTKVHKLK